MSTFQNIIVKVEMRTNNPRNPFRKLFEQQVKVDSNISVPYEKMIASLRFLFGTDTIVSFSNSELSYNNK